MNIFHILEDAAKKWPEEIALVHEARGFRYLELYSAAESLASQISRAGIRAGDKVGLLCPSSAECIAAKLVVASQAIPEFVSPVQNSPAYVGGTS